MQVCWMMEHGCIAVTQGKSNAMHLHRRKTFDTIGNVVAGKIRYGGNDEKKFIIGK